VQEAEGKRRAWALGSPRADTTGRSVPSHAGPVTRMALADRKVADRTETDGDSSGRGGGRIQ
jgi:hypothetical protein